MPGSGTQSSAKHHKLGHIPPQGKSCSFLHSTTVKVFLQTTGSLLVGMFFVRIRPGRILSDFGSSGGGKGANSWLAEQSVEVMSEGGG